MDVIYIYIYIYYFYILIHIINKINIYWIIEQPTIIYIIKLVQANKSMQLLLFIYNYFMVCKSKQSFLSILWYIIILGQSWLLDSLQGLLAPTPIQPEIHCWYSDHHYNPSFRKVESSKEFDMYPKKAS